MKEKNTIAGNLGSIFWTVLGLIIFITVIVVLVNSQTNKTNNEEMSINEAQTKCMLMEEADLVNLDGEPFNDATIKKAQDFCLSSWNTPEKEASFKEAVKMDWDNRKTEVLEGYTLEQLYDESRSK